MILQVKLRFKSKLFITKHIGNVTLTLFVIIKHCENTYHIKNTAQSLTHG